MTQNEHPVEPNKAPNQRYELVIKEQPQQCQVSGFGENDKLLPMYPTPIVQLMTYQDNQLVEPDKYHYPPCILHVSLWSKNQSQPLDMVHIIRHNQKAPIPSAPVRTMIGTLSIAPSVLYDQQHRLGVYFSFPDIGVRVASTYCLKFDLVFLNDEFFAPCSVATHIYSDPFIAYTAKNFPGTKESNTLTKHLARQGLQVAILSDF